MRAATEARADCDAATAAFDLARGAQQRYAFAVDMWDLAHPNENREPLPIIEGNAWADIQMSSPPSDEEVASLKKAAIEAESYKALAFNIVRQALDSAEAADLPAREPSPAGY